MVAAVPQHLAQRYGQWADKIPATVLADLTEDQVAGRLRRAQACWEAAALDGGQDVLTKALTDAGTILAAPAPGAKEGKRTSALKDAGLTGADMERHGRWLSRIPDGVLTKMDRPAALTRAELAASEFARTGSVDAADRVLSAPAHVVLAEPMTKAAQAATVRGVREDLARAYGEWIAKVPDEVLSKLDATELVDRCEHAKVLEARGKASPVQGAIHGYLDRARQVLGALPRAEVEAEAVRLEKAALGADEPQLVRGYMDRVRELRDANPQAPAVERPTWLGKAVRAPEPRTVPGVLHKADGAREKPATAKAASPTAASAKATPRKRRRPPMAKADAVRLGAGLDALEEALTMLRRTPELNKADGATRDTIDGLLNVADAAFNP
ncbi:hypothetical protein ACFY20_08880 [Streptomyces sp. NPDC001312]|uniref:hypothetical protein n=1 Tax=Streptomyces sp. NPDC001312 TaxID=3364561 RepID=UPI0036B01620